MRVPRYDQATIDTTALPTPQQSGASPISHAVSELGGTLGRVAGETEQYGLEQKAKADASSVMEQSKFVGERGLALQNDFTGRKGHAAMDPTQTLKDFDSLYSEARGNLKNDSQRTIFDQRHASDRLHFETVLERHAKNEMDTLNQENAVALVNIEEQKMSTLYRDPAQYDIKNPNSQINKVRAATADMLHMKGIAENDPAFHAGMQAAESKIYVDRIKQLMVETPAEAQHFFEVHQDDIEPHEREQLKHTVSVMSDEKAGIDAAVAISPEIMKGAKSYTELRNQLYEQLKDKPHAFKVAEQQLRGDYQAAKEDRAERVASMGSKVEQAITDSIATGRMLSPRQIAALPEYQALVKEGSKESVAEAGRFMRWAETEKKAAEREAKSDAAERRRERHEAERERKLSQAEYASALDDPDTLVNATDADIKALAPKIGYVNVKKLITSRHKYLKEEGALEHAKVDKDIMTEEMDGAGLKYQASPSKAETDDFKHTAKLKNRVASLMRWEQERTGKPVSPDRQKEIIREQLLKVKVPGRFWGENEVPQFEARPEEFQIPGADSGDIGMVVTAYRQRGIEPTYEMVTRGVAALRR